MSLSSKDNTATMFFNSDHKVGVAYEMVTREQALVVKSYDKPTSRKSISGQQYFRGEIEEGKKKLFPVLNHASCISFDQSYFTRTIGQLNIQAELGNDFSLFSGAGFGVIQAFSGALGRNTERLASWFTRGLRDSIHKSVVAKAGEVVASFMFEYDGQRLRTKPIINAIRKHFSDNGRDLLIRDCNKDVFIPIMDISGRIKVVNKKDYPNLPIYRAISAALFDPIFFKTKPEVQGLGVLNGDIAKNNAAFIRKNNPTLNIVSVGSPVRLFDKGETLINRDDLSLLISDQKHITDLLVDIGGPYKRYQCSPIDECYQFATDRRSMELALSSGDINA